MILRGLAFLAGNAVAQGAAALAGLLIARWMSVHDYALYTIFVTMTGAIAVLTKGGIHLGFSAILGRHWPDPERTARLIKAMLEARRLVSWAMMPLVIASTAYLLARNEAAPWQIGAILLATVAYWLADMRTKVIDQVLFFANQTTRVQLLDTVLAAARLLSVCAMHFAGVLNSIVVVLLSTLLAAARIPNIVRWIRRIVPETAALPLDEDRAEIRRTIVRQLPVEIYFVFQGQIVLFLLSLHGPVESVAQYGALTRISQLLLPLGAFVGAFLIPRFSAAKSRVLPLFFGLSALCALPSVALLAFAFLLPAPLLWLIGPNYANQQDALQICVIAFAFANIAGCAWSLAAHRGWNRWTWTQVPVGVAWCLIAPWLLDLHTIEGVLWLQAGFSFGLVVATSLDLLNAVRLREI